jgi:hypothetical protein
MLAVYGKEIKNVFKDTCGNILASTPDGTVQLYPTGKVSGTNPFRIKYYVAKSAKEAGLTDAEALAKAELAMNYYTMNFDLENYDPQLVNKTVVKFLTVKK